MWSLERILLRLKGKCSSRDILQFRETFFIYSTNLVLLTNISSSERIFSASSRLNSAGKELEQHLVDARLIVNFNKIFFRQAFSFREWNHRKQHLAIRLLFRALEYTLLLLLEGPF